MPRAEFLSGVTLRPVKLPERSSLRAVGLAIGSGASPLEVLVAECDHEPPTTALRGAWKERNAGRASPLLLVVLHGLDHVGLCGPSGEEPPAYTQVDRGQAERICRDALELPDRHAALRYLRGALPAVSSELPGVLNEGFLATHELVRGAQRLAAWGPAGEKARRVLQQRGDALLAALGYAIEPCDQVTQILRIGQHGHKVAVAVLLRQSESPELQADRFNGLSPVSYALAVAERENLPYVIVSQGSRVRIYPVRPGVGVGRRSPSNTYLEVHTGLLRDTDAAYLWLLFSAEALAEKGSLDQLLDESKIFASNLAEGLRERIYADVIPRLAEGIAFARGLKKPTVRNLAETYEMAMTFLFRLLFIAYAEDMNLLPYRGNDLYKSRSLKTKAQEILKLKEGNVPFDESNTLWGEVREIFQAVENGKAEWGVPAYDGGLFSSDPANSRVGALLEQIRLPNTVLGPVLGDLLVRAPGPVDFRSLSVREFGTVYEGLLESQLSVAETDLAVDKNGFYRPCRPGEEAVVRERRIYLHNRSGARKSTGGYFTKSFAVEHLLDKALEPALAEHLKRLDALDDDAAAEAFFDFRVADIAMGSGHFLVAALDRVERGFAGYIARRRLPGVRQELIRLREAAVKALGPLADSVEIEDTQLLRRLIARRCVYGVDINPVAVELARLSIWIHTFVPGLPLSLLDRNLVVGNSLVGIGRVSEIEEKAKEDDLPIFGSFDVERLVGEALVPLQRLARTADATLSEVDKARKAMREAQEATLPAKALCDITTACRMTGEKLQLRLDTWDHLRKEILDSKYWKKAREALGTLCPLHFPVAFPEVFLRKRHGFDVILGNPPWEEATLEEHAFWARHDPGLRSLPQRRQEQRKAELRRDRPDLVALYEEELAQAETLRKALTAGSYPGMGTGDPDLYKAFCWRFWRLVSSEGGWIGVVLPRSALSAKGTAAFRVEVFKNASPVSILTLLNTGGWVFDDAEPRYTIGLVGVCRSQPEGKSIRLLGPFASKERFDAGSSRPPSEFAATEVMGWTDSASLPLLPTEESLEVFAQLRKAPRLDLNDGRSWKARPHRELDATNDKGLMDVKSKDCPRGFWPVFKGESFDLWKPDTGAYYAWADPKKVVPHLHEKALHGTKLAKSVFSEFPTSRFAKPESLPCFSPRIAFRDVTRATDSRTVRVALLPPRVFIGNQAPYLLWPRGGACDEAYLLGLLSSLPLDWYARRFVETHVNFFVFNPFPVPRPPEKHPLRLRVIELAGRLAASDDRFSDWARAVGVACGPLSEEEKEAHIHELDAVVALLFDLEERHLVHVFETFHEGWNYERRMRETLQHFSAWKSRMRSGG